MKSPDLAVVMPIYNEEANIRGVVTEWIGEFARLGISFVVVAVNDGSRDGTTGVLAELAREYPGGVEVIDKINAGHGQARRTGYARAVEIGAPWTLQIDSDGQCEPRFFAEFWDARAEADAVFGRRTTRDDGFARVLVSEGCRVATSLFTGMRLADPNVPYRLIRTERLREALAKIPADFEMQNVALTLALRRNPAVRWRHVPIHFRNRQGGTNSINLRRIAGMGAELLLSLHRVGR